MTSGPPAAELRDRLTQLSPAERAALLDQLRPPASTDRRWARYGEKPDPGLRVFCFSYAGGGPSVFRPLAEVLAGTDIEVWSAQLPGRGVRADESAHRRIDPLVDEFGAAITAHLDRPYVLLGYSMGALVAFELTRWLRAEQAPPPAALQLAAFRAPQLPNPNIKVHYMPDDVLKTILVKEGTPPEVVADDELMRVALPTLRADLELCDTYGFDRQSPLDLPMSVYGGEFDVRVSRTDLEQWRIQTTGPFQLTMFAGPHFFIHSDRDGLFSHLAGELAEISAARKGQS
ncbi:thioesterase II family protein [Nocardia rhizosphaerae]|uniref:Thioesterase TesA n=1 Tax=Nocardia rhizosphaerae TaxID=1691571 RepID=A0ABV8LBP4_9NOCA